MKEKGNKKSIEDEIIEYLKSELEIYMELKNHLKRKLVYVK